MPFGGHSNVSLWKRYSSHTINSVDESHSVVTTPALFWLTEQQESMPLDALCWYSSVIVHSSTHRLAGAGLQPWGCQSLLDSACFQGESFGSFFVFFRGRAAGTSSAEGTGGSCGISFGAGSCTAGWAAASWCSMVRGGSALPLISWSMFIWFTPLSGSLDWSICIGCCLSGASSADGLDAQRSSALAASTFILSCRAISWCCSVMVGGSKRVCRSHCIHDAETCQ